MRLPPSKDSAIHHKSTITIRLRPHQVFHCTNSLIRRIIEGCFLKDQTVLEEIVACRWRSSSPTPPRERNACLHTAGCPLAACGVRGWAISAAVLVGFRGEGVGEELLRRHGYNFFQSDSSECCFGLWGVTPRLFFWLDCLYEWRAWWSCSRTCHWWLCSWWCSGWWTAQILTRLSSTSAEVLWHLVEAHFLDGGKDLAKFHSFVDLVDPKNSLLTLMFPSLEHM